MLPYQYYDVMKEVQKEHLEPEHYDSFNVIKMKEKFMIK